MARHLIRAYAVLAALAGLGSGLMFFPSGQGCGGLWSCLPYSSSGFVLMLAGVGLLLLRPLAFRAAILFSAAFSTYFISATLWVLATDDTGQGLVGLVLLLPMFLASLFGFLLLLPQAKKEFK